MADDRPNCRYAGGCSNVARRRGLCSKHGADEAEVDSPLVDVVKERGAEREILQTVREHVQNIDQLVRVCAIDTAVWEVVEWAVATRSVATTRKGSAPLLTPVFTVRAKLRRKTALIDARAEIAAMKADAKAGLPTVRPLRVSKPAGDHLLQIAIPDLHMGKLAWKPETGQNYDLKIAEATFETALAKLVSRTASHRFGRVLFLVGSDLLHTDNPNGTTTKGTPQDTDGRFHRTFRKTRQMVVRAVDHLRGIAPVDVLVVPGNHDEQSAWHLGDSLECWYHGATDVRIDNTPTHRKYYEFGSVMLAFSHGDKGKREDLPLLMATEEPEMFGRTRYREAHTGHIHTLQVMEKHGVRVRTSPALCAADAWHAHEQYVGNQRAAEAFVWSPTEGLVSQATWTVPEEAA